MWVNSHPSEGEAVDDNPSQVGTTSPRVASRPKPTARKRKVIEPSSPLSSVPSSDNEDMRQTEDDDDPMSGRITIDNKLEAYSVQPASSPPLGLVTQLPVMSMDTEEDDTQLSPTQPSSAMNLGDLAAQGDSLQADYDTEQMEKVVSDDALKEVEDPLPVVNHYLWELDDDEDGLFEVDIRLDKLESVKL